MKRTVILDNATIWAGDGRAFDGHVSICDGRIQNVASGRYRGDLPAVDLGGLYLSPGMIDPMVCGGFNRTLLRDSPSEIAADYLGHGVTAVQFCIGTFSWEDMAAVAERVRQGMHGPQDAAAAILGVYFEGPFQKRECAGGNLVEWCLDPTPQNVHRLLNELDDVVRTINVSPGIEGDAAAVAALRAAGKVVSMAHSNAPAEVARRCVDAGTTVLGHAWDNNFGLQGDTGLQQPTLEHLALIDDRITAIHMIADGEHVHPLYFRLALRCRGVESICLVTDSLACAGGPDGEYEHDDGQRFVKRGGVGRSVDRGTLFGSALLLPDHLRNFIRFTGLPPHVAIRAVTLNPAASLGIENEVGLVAPGRMADLVLWDDRMQVRRVWRAGREIHGVVGRGEIELAGEARAASSTVGHSPQSAGAPDA